MTSWAQTLGLGATELAHLADQAKRDARRGAAEDARAGFDLLLLLDPGREETWAEFIAFEKARGNTDMAEALEEVKSWLR